MKPVHDEKRAGRRYALQLPIIISAAGDRPTISGNTRDVSAVGVFFYTGFRLAPLSDFECSLILPDTVAPPGKNVLACSGRVVRVEEGKHVFGVGAKFDKIAFGGETWNVTRESPAPDLSWLLRIKFSGPPPVGE